MVTASPPPPTPPTPPPAPPAAPPAPPALARSAVLGRWTPWLIIAVVVIAAGVVGLQRSSHPSLDQRTLSIAGQVRCPVCNGQSAAQSDAPPALAIRSQIRTELAAGQSSSVILAGIAKGYGSGILEKPQATGVGLIVWVLPLLAVAGAILGLVLAFRRWRPSALTGPGATDTDRELVGEALREAPSSGPVARPPAPPPSSPSPSPTASPGPTPAPSAPSEPAP